MNCFYKVEVIFEANLTPDSVCRFIGEKAITAPYSLLSVEKLLIWAQSDSIAVIFEFKGCDQLAFILEARPAEVVVVEFSGEQWISLKKSLDCMIISHTTWFRHRANYDR